MAIARRSFLALAGLAGMGGLAAQGTPSGGSRSPFPERGGCASLSLDGETLTVRTPAVRQPHRLLLVGDAHYATDDARGEPFRRYSARMSGGPRDMGDLRKDLERGREAGCEAALFLGDMLNFPSEAGVEQLTDVIAKAPLPTHYISGNHDWHYEGLPGTEADLRREWVARRLKPLYRGHDPMAYAVRLGELKILMVDDSTYEILPAQLEFLRRELADGAPAVLAAHIPLHLAWRRGDIFFGVGHPDWGAATDPYWEIERRERWPEGGHSQTTLAFWREAWAAPNLLGVVAGHIHTQSVDAFDGRFLFVLPKRTPRQLLVQPA